MQENIKRNDKTFKTPLKQATQTPAFHEMQQHGSKTERKKATATFFLKLGLRTEHDVEVHHVLGDRQQNTI